MMAMINMIRMIKMTRMIKTINMIRMINMIKMNANMAKNNFGAEVERLNVPVHAVAQKLIQMTSVMKVTRTVNPIVYVQRVKYGIMKKMNVYQRLLVLMTVDQFVKVNEAN